MGLRDKFRDPDSLLYCRGPPGDPLWYGYLDDGRGWTARPKSQYMQSPDYNSQLRHQLRDEKKQRQRQQQQQQQHHNGGYGYGYGAQPPAYGMSQQGGPPAYGVYPNEKEKMKKSNSRTKILKTLGEVFGGAGSGAGEVGNGLGGDGGGGDGGGGGGGGGGGE